MNDEGSAGVVLLAVGAVVMVLAVGVATVGQLLVARIEAGRAADAAALAAAPVTFASFGARHGPAEEAHRFASLNGARLIFCTCPIDRTWNPRTVEVRVEVDAQVPGVGPVAVAASSRATFAPASLVPGG